MSNLNGRLPEIKQAACDEEIQAGLRYEYSYDLANSEIWPEVSGTK